MKKQETTISPDAPKKRGGQPHVPTDETRATVRNLAELGVKYSIIAVAIKSGSKKKPITAKTLKNHYKAELEEGSREANSTVLQSLFDMATSGRCPAATIFWAKTRCRLTPDYQQDDTETPKEPKPPKALPAPGSSNPQPLQGFRVEINNEAPNDGL